MKTVNRDHDRISINGVRCVLLEQQATALDIPLEKTFISKGASDEKYENELLKVLKKQRDNGVSYVVFGDIFLEDVRKYRERILAKARMNGVFPFWKKDTQTLAHKFINLGFKAVITSVDSYVLTKDFVGGEYDKPVFVRPS